MAKFNFTANFAGARCLVFSLSEIIQKSHIFLLVLLGSEPLVVGVAKFFRGLVIEGEGIAIAVGFGVVGDGGAHFGNEFAVLPKIFGGGVGGDVIRLGVAVFLLAARLTGESEDCFQSFVCLDIDQAQKLLGELDRKSVV